MKQKLHFFLAFLLAFVGVTQSSAEDADYVYKEKLLYKTNFQDWEDVKADKTKAVAVEKQMKNGETLTFYLYNTAVDNDGIDTGKFTAEGVTPDIFRHRKIQIRNVRLTSRHLQSPTLQSSRFIRLQQAAHEALP